MADDAFLFGDKSFSFSCSGGSDNNANTVFTSTTVSSEPERHYVFVEGKSNHISACNPLKNGELPPENQEVLADPHILDSLDPAISASNVLNYADYSSRPAGFSEIEWHEQKQRLAANGGEQ